MIVSARCPADCSVSCWQLARKGFLKLIINTVIIALFLHILGILETITERLISKYYMFIIAWKFYPRIKCFHLGPADCY